MDRESLLHQLKTDSKVLTDERLERAFTEVDRALFLGPDYQSEAYEDYAVPIGHGANIPQPTTTAFMFELLGIQEGERVLLVGAGSGWSSAIAATLAGQDGSVVATEIVPELCALAEQNIERAHLSNVSVIPAGGEVGAPEQGPFDRIIAFAAADKLPYGLLQQLSIGGTLVMPIGDTLYRFVKTSDFDFTDEAYPGFSFQPLKGNGTEQVEEDAAGTEERE